jgi:hypothetical protein
MKAAAHRMNSASGPGPGAARPVRVADPGLTPKAEAKAANKLPRREQLNRFEQDLEATDSGNQPA